MGLPLSQGYTNLGCTYNDYFNVVALRKRGDYKVQHKDRVGHSCGSAARVRAASQWQQNTDSDQSGYLWLVTGQCSRRLFSLTT